MSAQSALRKEVFAPRGERVLAAVEVRRRRRGGGRRLPFLSSRGGKYATFLCLSVTKKAPRQLLITKVKRFAGSAPLVSRSQWRVDQLRQVNGIDPHKDCPELDLVFDNGVDQWVCSSSAEKCVFILILHRAYQTYAGVPPGTPAGLPGGLGKGGALRRMSLDAGRIPPLGPGSPPKSRALAARRKSCVPATLTEFINCHPKLTGEAPAVNLFIYRCRVFFTRLRKRMAAKGPPAPPPPGGIMGNVVQRLTVSVGERGERLSRAEDRTVELMHKTQQLADTTHKLALKFSK